MLRLRCEGRRKIRVVRVERRGNQPEVRILGVELRRRPFSVARMPGSNASRGIGT